MSILQRTRVRRRLQSLAQRDARATRSAQVRHWWAAAASIVSRLMRDSIRAGAPIGDLPRGIHAPWLAGERNALGQRGRCRKGAYQAESSGGPEADER